MVVLQANETHGDGSLWSFYLWSSTRPAVNLRPSNTQPSGAASIPWRSYQVKNAAKKTRLDFRTPKHNDEAKRGL